MFSFAFVISLSGCYFPAGFTGQWEPAPAPLPGKARGLFILRVILLFPGFHISFAGSSSPATPSAQHCAGSERTVS